MGVASVLKFAEETASLARLLALPMLRFRLRFEAPPSWRNAPGTAWRGAFGHALRNRLCGMHRAECPGCPAESGCAFPLFFPAAQPRAADTVAAMQVTPFVLDPAPDVAQVDCTLMGPGAPHAVAVLGALAEAAKMGVGPRRTSLRLLAVSREVPVGSGKWRGVTGAAAPVICPPDIPATIQLRFLSPLRLRQQGSNVAPRDFAFAGLAASLMRRASALLAQSGVDTRDIDWRGLSDRARAVAWTRHQFGWQEFERRSERQQATMILGGVVGRAEVDGDAVGEFWPLLWLGQWLHAGKGASFGFGKYRIRSVAGVPS